jgi:hypothetical protein
MVNKQPILILAMWWSMVCFTSAAAQTSLSQDTISWKVESFNDVNSGELVSITSEFVSYQTNAIQWIQKNGEYVMDFTITAIEGTWSNPQENGRIVYRVKYGTQPGTITIQRTNGVTTILTDFQMDGKNVMPFSFKISSIQKL